MNYQQKDGLGRLTLDDGKANAMQLDWCNQLNQVLDEVERDNCHALVIEGRPGFFSGGLDLKVLPLLPPDELRKTTEHFVNTMRRLFLFPKPVIGASAGLCQYAIPQPHHTELILHGRILTAHQTHTRGITHPS
jgi:enoyl-CoA hydratase/carnithine racemase